MHIVIMGCGRVGSSLADRLDAEGHSVAVIDKNTKARFRLSKRFGGRFIVGIGFSRRVLEEANIGEADAFISVTSGDNSNIVGARTAREDFHVPKVVARIYDPRRADIYRDLGIPTVATVRWTVNEIHQLLFHKELAPDLTFGNGENLLVRSTVPAYLEGRSVSEFNVEGEIMVVEVTRGGRSVIPGPATMIEPGDILSFVVATTSLGRLKSFLNKELGV
ncbi:MAG: TrkA family potassium uptake protein [Acidimicrobiia bacterium]|nr:TrkA family potassium uptake protein [Acidimicrobiia bacterium]